jgi:hypothetical protein
VEAAAVGAGTCIGGPVGALYGGMLGGVVGNAIEANWADACITDPEVRKGMAGHSLDDYVMAGCIGTIEGIGGFGLGKLLGKCGPYKSLSKSITNKVANYISMEVVDSVIGDMLLYPLVKTISDQMDIMSPAQTAQLGSTL